ncbi:MAG: YraN family protein [Victivallales bacterium]|nr:YraN family protein [Victivallales bacterium]
MLEWKKIRRFIYKVIGKTRRRLRKAFRPRRFWRLRAAHLRLGRRGENIACRTLEELGIDVLERNVRNRHGEIDIIARDGMTLCFIEVKTRHKNAFSRPADAVDEMRRHRLSRAAGLYMRCLGDRVQVKYRFDIMEIVYDKKRLRNVHYMRNAFRDRRLMRHEVNR